MQTERDNTGQQAPGDTHRECPMLEVGNPLFVWMSGHCCHGSSLPFVEFHNADRDVRMGRNGVRWRLKQLFLAGFALAGGIDQSNVLSKC